MYRRLGDKIVLTNGCFDILHAGHVRFLKSISRLGDALIVLLNSDSSVRALKGPTRPVNSQEDRAVVLSSLEFVDGVFIFDDKRICKWLRLIRPVLWAKGGDYTLDSLDRSEVLAAKAVGTKIAVGKFHGGLSTSKILARL